MSKAIFSILPISYLLSKCQYFPSFVNKIFVFDMNENSEPEDSGIAYVPRASSKISKTNERSTTEMVDNIYFATNR